MVTCFETRATSLLAWSRGDEWHRANRQLSDAVELPVPQHHDILSAMLPGVVPVIAGPLQTLLALAPALLLACGLFLVALLSPRGLRHVARFLLHQKLFSSLVFLLLLSLLTGWPWSKWLTSRNLDDPTVPPAVEHASSATSLPPMTESVFPRHELAEHRFVIGPLASPIPAWRRPLMSQFAPRHATQHNAPQSLRPLDLVASGDQLLALAQSGDELVAAAVPLTTGRESPPTNILWNRPFRRPRFAGWDVERRQVIVGDDKHLVILDGANGDEIRRVPLAWPTAVWVESPSEIVANSSVIHVEHELLFVVERWQWRAFDLPTGELLEKGPVPSENVDWLAVRDLRLAFASGSQLTVRDLVDPRKPWPKRHQVPIAKVEQQDAPPPWIDAPDSMNSFDWSREAPMPVVPMASWFREQSGDRLPATRLVIHGERLYFLSRGGELVCVEEQAR